MIRDKTSPLHYYFIIVSDKGHDGDNPTLIQRTWTTEIRPLALWSQYIFQLEKVHYIIITLNCEHANFASIKYLPKMVIAFCYKYHCFHSCQC